MEENKLMQSRIDKWFHLTEAAEILSFILFLFSSCYFSMISIFFLVCLVAKSKLSAIFGSLWHSFVVMALLLHLFNVINPIPLIFTFFNLFKDDYLSLSIFSNILLNGVCVFMYIKACYYAGELERLSQNPSAVHNSPLPKEPKHPVYINIIKNMMSSSSAADTPNADCSDKIGGNTDSIRNQTQKTEPVNYKKRPLIRKPEDIIDYTEILTVVLIIIGILKLHPLNWIICTAEAFFLTNALIARNTRSMKMAMWLNISAPVLLIIVGPAGSDVFVYLFLIISYAILAIFYYKSNCLMNTKYNNNNTNTNTDSNTPGHDDVYLDYSDGLVRDYDYQKRNNTRKPISLIKPDIPEVPVYKKVDLSKKCQAKTVQMDSISANDISKQI